MTVDTKGFVLTQCKDVLKIGSLAVNAIDSLITADRKERMGARWYTKEVREQYSPVECVFSPDSELLKLYFTFRGEKRSMCLFFGCDSDHRNFGPHSISMSMGCSGYSEVYVQAVLHALSLLGPAYFVACDTRDDEEPAPLAMPAPNLLQAMALKYAKSSYLDKWVAFATESGVVTGRQNTFKDFFGASRKDILDLLNIEDFKERTAAIEVLAQKQPVIERPFLAQLSEVTA